MERTIENLDSLKEHWLENNFIGGAILCSFILVKQKGLDLVFDGNHSLVKEYKELLKKRLESDNIQLLLMVNTEIERCYYREESEEIYRLLPDEIYDHYDKGGKNYPIQAVVLHIEIIRALHNMDEIDESADYLWTLKETYESCFGSESYRFCINWCHILKEVLIEYAPEVEIAEFEKNVDLFMSQLGEEVIFYDLCLKTAVRNQQINQELPLFEQAIELCNSSLKNCKTEVRKELWSYVDGFIAKGWRQLGKIDNAIKYLKKAKEGTQDSKYQMFLLSHIASLYYEKKDFDAMYHYIQEGLMLVNTLDVLDENVAELYNAYGMYNLDLGRYEKAMHEIERAVDISKKVTGEESDQVMKFKSNIALVNFRNGYYDKACEQLDELLDIALTSGKQYKISLPLIINNMIGMGDNFKLSSLTVNKIKKAFNLAYDMHDDVTASYVKSNFYYLMVTSGNSYEYINELEQELEEYYNANPNAQGYIEFLKAMAHRYACNNKLSNASLLLEKVCDYYQKVPLKAWSIEYLNYFYIKLRLNLYKKNFRESREMFSSLYENVMFPLFEQLEEKKQETFIERIRSYVSIYISAYQQYPEMQLLVSELYDFVLNTKYLIDLYSRDSNKLKKIIRGKNQLSYKDIKMDKESLVIESIIYAKHDLLKNDNFIGTKILTNSVEEYTYLMSFVINCTNTFVKTKHVDILSNKSWNEIIDELFQDSGEDNRLYKIEVETWAKMKPWLQGKRSIYVCDDSCRLPFPLAGMRINQQEYIGDRYDIIYCNTGGDVQKDITIKRFEDSLFFGTFDFEVDTYVKEPKVRKHFTELCYAAAEIDVLERMTHGVSHIGKEITEQNLQCHKASIIHFATHTIMTDDTQEIALVLKNEEEKDIKVITKSDIQKFNWKGVKLVTFSACETGIQLNKQAIDSGLCQAAKVAGAQSSISTLIEVEDGSNAFFMVCFYKYLMQYQKVSVAFSATQRTMRIITKKEIVSDSDYLDIGMDVYLQNYSDSDKPFDNIDDWAGYIYQMNGE